jgi:hypothetical protein
MTGALTAERRLEHASTGRPPCKEGLEGRVRRPEPEGSPGQAGARRGKKAQDPPRGIAPVSRVRAVLLASAFLTLLLPLPHAQACAAEAAHAATNAAVPCGYIYPRLLFDLGARGAAHTLTMAQPLLLEGTLTFTWDITAEGMAAPNPASPIVVTFDFPRKPDWLSIEVEPPALEIPISPQYVVTSPSADGPSMVYVYEAPIAVRATLLATPTLEAPGQPSMLVLAQSSESGLYKPGFGIRDLPLALPEAIVPASAAAEGRALRIGAPEALALPPLAVEFEGATVTLEAREALALWEPASLVARVQRGGAPVRGLDLTATVVDEANTIQVTTGLRHAPEGSLAFTYTFPAPGHYRVHVAARPVPGASDAAIDPLVATFDLALPGTQWDALRYPDAYRASYEAPISDLQANPQELPRQFEMAWPFPVLAGAESASVQVRLGSSLSPALGAGSVYAEVLSPSGEQVAFGKLDMLAPSWDARLRAPLAQGQHTLRLWGTGANALGLGGSTLAADLGVFYPQQPLGMVEARGAPRPMDGGAIALGTGGMLLDLVLHDAPTPWQPMHAMLAARDAQGRTALHPDFILTVTGPAEHSPFGGGVLHTTGHRHPHDGLLHWAFTPPAPGDYLVSAYAGPTPEASGAFWQPAIASWPLRVAAPASGAYPQVYRAEYHDSASTVRPLGYAQGAAFDKRYAVPILAHAQELHAVLRVGTMAMVQHAEGAGPAALTLEVLDPGGRVLAASEPLLGQGQVEVRLPQPSSGLHVVRVAGAGYAPLDYGGAMLNLTIEVPYEQAPPAPGRAAPAGEDAVRSVPGAPLAMLGLALLAVLRRRTSR